MRLRIAPILLTLLSLSRPGCATPALEVSAGVSQPADALVEWCATPASASFEWVANGGCRSQPLTGDLARGIDRRAFWGRLALRNAGAEAVERWISVGHPRLAEVTLFDPAPSGLTRHDVGKRAPMSQRGPVERAFGALPVYLAPGETKTVWLRVWSDTAVDLSTTVWRPAAYIDVHQSTQFWIILSLGGLFIAIVFALMMLAVTHEAAYAYFSVCLTGALFNVAYVSGLAQRFLWPVDWPLRSEYVAMSVLIGIFGYFGYIRAFLSKHLGATSYRLLKASVGVTALLVAYGCIVDYASVLRLWNLSFVVVMASGAALSHRAWKQGDRAAGILLLSFGITLAWQLLRLVFSLGWAAWFSQALLFGAWALTLSAAIALLSLMDRSREQLQKLAVIQAENENRLTFLAHMSHELRSPLDNILGNAQLLARNGQAPSHPARLAGIFESGRHMLRLIDHILDYARGLAGVVKASPEPMRLETFLRRVERMARLHAARQDNQFLLRDMSASAHDGDLALRLDADHLWRILDNLISNAARHTRGGVITLDVGATRVTQDAFRLDFAVSDTGEGIAAEHLHRIFQPFERGGHQAAADGKGAGLGLAIARQLTELMGGRLSVVSEAGRGACFSFSILARTAPADDAPVSDDWEGLDARGYAGRRRSVLIVDDDPGNRSVLALVLGDLGFIVSEAHSGARAIALLDELLQLDLVITDQFMLDGDGWMVLQRLFSKKHDALAFLVSAAPPTPPATLPPGCAFAATFLRPLDHRRLVQRIGDSLGLTWIHDLPDAAGDDAAPDVATGADDDVLSQADARLFEELVETGQVTALTQWAGQLKAASPGMARLADRVIVAATALDMEMLRKLCHSVAKRRG